MYSPPSDVASSLVAQDALALSVLAAYADVGDDEAVALCDSLGKHVVKNRSIVPLLYYLSPTSCYPADSDSA